MTAPIPRRSSATARRPHPVTCAADGCHRATIRLSGYCSLHEATLYRTGHPLGAAPGTRVKPYAGLARDWLDSYRHHPATVALFEALGAILRSNYEAAAGAERPLLRHLQASGVEPEAVALAAGTIYLHSHFDRLFYRDTRHVDGIAAQAVARLAPRQLVGKWRRSWGSLPRRRLGDLLRETAALYWLTAAGKMSRDFAASDSVRKALEAQPF